MSEDQAAFEGATAGATIGTDIVALVEHNPVIVLVDSAKKEALFAHIEKEVAEFRADVSTAKGREECRSFAAKIVRTKTTVDKSRLALTEEARQKIKSVNAEGAVIEERLKALAATARAPLTAWEDAEEARETKCKGILDELRAAAVVPMGVSSEMLRDRIGEIEGEDMSEELWQGMAGLATTARDTALQALKAALKRVEQEEKDRAELAALRVQQAEQAAREERDREDRERAEQEAKEAQAAKDREAQEEASREAERERQAQEAKAEKERTRIASEQAAAAAADAARAEEAQRAADEAAERQRAHEAELQAERDRAAEAERQAKAEREAREEEDRRRAAAEQAAAAERARLEADADRRRAAKREAKVAIMQSGCTEEQAQKIVLLIIAGDVPRVFLDFAAEPKVRPASPVPGVGQGAGDNLERTLV